MPLEGVVSNICTMFTCTPSEALEQDPAQVFPISQFRLAESAMQLMNEKQSDKMTDAQANILLELGKLVPHEGLS